MPSLSKHPNRYYLRFYNGGRRPKQKKVALKTTRKCDSEGLRAKLVRDYHLGTFDPWRDDPFTYDRSKAMPRTLEEAANAFTAAKETDGQPEHCTHVQGNSESPH